MRALHHEGSKEYFKKYQKPTEDIETTMNNLEAKKIANIVGIDLAQAEHLSWFFQLVTKLKLPQYYTRVLNENKDEVIYLNNMTHQQSNQHPSLPILKTLFYETLANNKAVYTFLEKESKLLPFVEEKMLRQCIGLSSKRRDAEKVNLQRDQKGRMVMSKLQRIKPDFKSLLSSRSYMLKMLVEKVFTRKEVIGKGKRANAYANIVAEVKRLLKQSQPEKEEEEIDSEENIELYQRLFISAHHFYQQQFGDLSQIPQQLINSKEYLESTPENILKNIFLLSIDKDSIELYWLARIMDCLPLPPNWSKRKGTSFDSYTYQPQKLIFDIHPSYVYILNQINTFKSYFCKLGTLQQNYYYSMRQLTFFDFFERSYTVDLYGYIENYSKKTAAEKKAIERKKLKNEQTSDWMVLEGIKNSPITPYSFILAQHVERYWNSLNFWEEPWCPSISPFGQVVWSSNINEKSMSFNPYKPILSKIVSNQLIRLPQIRSDELKKEYRAEEQMKVQEQKLKQNNEQKEDSQGQEEYQAKVQLNTAKLIKEREEFLTYYMSHIEKAVPWPYQLKNKFQIIDQQTYYEQIFVSPFQLDQNLVPQGQPIPFWLEKCRAKNHTIDQVNLLLFNPQNFNQIKQSIASYSLEMVGDHQPYLLQQTQKKLNRISTPQQLIKFVNYINDLDSRQQRIKQYQESLIQLESDQDIFGSEISQVEVKEDMDQEEQGKEEEVEEEPEKSVSEKESVKEPSFSESSQEEIEPIQQAPAQEQQVIPPPREQYQFLKNFPKKVYNPVHALQVKKQQQLKYLLQFTVSKKKRMSKYKQGIIQKKIQRQIRIYEKITNPKKGGKERTEAQKLATKRNLIITNLRHAHLPYRANKQMFNVEGEFSERQSEMNYSEISDYEDFRSEISDYDTNEIEELIRQKKRQKEEMRKIKQKTPSEQEQESEPEVTQDTIELQPIYQIKPEIKKDPILRHVKLLSGELTQFRKTFNQKSKQTLPFLAEEGGTTTEHPVTAVRSKSLKSLRQEINYQSTPTPHTSSMSLKKIDRAVESKLSTAKRETFRNTLREEPPKPFHRVCLQSTASHFLAKQAFLRKGDIVTMQARKLLLTKGRGLQTYISKFY